MESYIHSSVDEFCSEKGDAHLPSPYGEKRSGGGGRVEKRRGGK